MYHFRIFLLCTVLFILVFSCPETVFSAPVRNVEYIPLSLRNKITNTLTMKHGTPEKGRIESCISQTADHWTEEDGTPEEFEQFCIENFITDKQTLAELLNFAETKLEIIDRNFFNISADTLDSVNLRSNKAFYSNRFLRGYSPYVHLGEDLYTFRSAFVILLNFPLLQPEQMSRPNYFWMKEFTNNDWAAYRLVRILNARVPATLLSLSTDLKLRAKTHAFSQEFSLAAIMDSTGKRCFEDSRSLSYPWQAIYEIKRLYADKTPQAILRQEILLRSIDRAAQDQFYFNEFKKDQDLGWDPVSNSYFKNNVKISFAIPQNLTKASFLKRFSELEQKKDSYFEPKSNFISRYFDYELEIGRDIVEKTIYALLSSKQIPTLAQKLKNELGRDLRPFDLWYSDFQRESGISYEKLDRLTKERYSSVAELRRDIKIILLRLGFSKTKSDFMADRIVIEEAKGETTSTIPRTRGDKVYIRVLFSGDGLSYEEYKASLYELGKCCAGILSVYNSDSYLLAGLPGSAFYEAYGSLFVRYAEHSLGVESISSDENICTTDEELWGAWGSAGSTLHSILLMKWIDENPEASELQIAFTSTRIAKEIWNKYYTPVLGGKDLAILACQSRTFYSPLTLSANFMGRVIAAQIRSGLNIDKGFAAEVDKMCSTGRLTPDAWLTKNTGKPLSADFFLNN